MPLNPVGTALPDVPSKVHIIGGPGSGKTTLAQQLAQVVAAPVYSLDEVAYENGAGAKYPLATRHQKIQEILGQPTWITEGVFLWWIEPLLAAATTIVWLDLPWPVAVWRIVGRHLKLSWTGDNPHPGVLRLGQFVRWQVTHYYRRGATEPATPDEDSAVTRAATAHALTSYADRVVPLRTAREVAAFRSAISSTSSVVTAEAGREDGG